MEEKTRRVTKIYRIFMTILITVFISSGVTAIAINKYYNENPVEIEKIKEIKVETVENEVDLPDYLKTLKAYIDLYYKGEINDEDLVTGAIKGYVDGLGDKYTVYYTPDEMEEFEIATEGNYIGIGVYMGVVASDGTIMIIAPIPGSPAEEAGIKSGDIIIKVDGVAYSGDEMEKASNYIKGEAGTKVNLEIERDGEILNFEVERKEIDIAPVESEILEGNIGYISLLSFDEGCSDEIKEKIQEFNDKNIDKIILDLRNNGGGLVDEALSILELFVDEGDNLLITVDKYDKEEINKSKKSPETEAKLIVLTNVGSASASEIVAGTLQDLGRATIVGEKTYGKGVIQALLPLSDGAGLKVTIEEYFTANKNKINGIGIVPDVEVEENLDTEEDEQLNKAIELLK